MCPGHHVQMPAVGPGGAEPAQRWGSGTEDSGRPNAGGPGGDLTPSLRCLSYVAIESSRPMPLAALNKDISLIAAYRSEAKSCRASANW